MFQYKIQQLGDLELAVLVSLVAQQHCILSTNSDSDKSLGNELRLICESIFGLKPAIIECSPSTTVDEFSEGVLVDSLNNDLEDAEAGYFRSRPTLAVDFTPTRGRSPRAPGSNTLDERRIADVIIAVNLDQAAENVQIQALELIRTKRIFTRTAMHSASRDLMVLAISSSTGARLNHHLNDLFCMSHFHPEEDGLPYQEGQLSKEAMPSFSREDIADLRNLAEEARLTPEIAAYMHNICVFMKNSRYIQSGITATATRQLRVLAKALAPLHGLNYVPPSLVTLAVRKIYPHRIRLATPETERSLLWGSDPVAAKALLEGFTVEDAIEDVLAAVETPLLPLRHKFKLETIVEAETTPTQSRRMPWLTNERPRHHMRSPTFPLYHSSRKKPRRWPLVLRVIKGSIHADIALPVVLHAAIACLVCYLDKIKDGHFGLPSSTIPSLSIVVGLMLVFRNGTSYDRFWQGNNHLTNMVTCIRCLSRNFLTCSYAAGKAPPTEAERADTERTVRVLLALVFAAKNHLRAEWGQTLPMLLPTNEIERRRRESRSTSKAEYSDLLPSGTRSFEEQGLGLLQQLTIQIDAYIKRGEGRSWWSAPQASQMTVQLNALVKEYGNMETIHLTPLPVALLIHMRQVLALFCCVLPFALVEEMGWWTVLMVSFVAFTLYGIEAIGCQLEDPFGYDKNDIKVDAIAEDLRVEIGVMIEEWRRQGPMFKVV